MGPKNTLGDLNNILFEELERLNDDELKGEELQQEMNRAKAITGVATQVVMNARTVLDAARFQDDKMDLDTPVPAMLMDGRPKKRTGAK